MNHPSTSISQTKTKIVNPFDFCKPFNSTEHVREGWLHYACWATEISQFWGYEAKQCNAVEQLNDNYKIENITFQDRFFRNGFNQSEIKNSNSQF